MSQTDKIIRLPQVVAAVGLQKSAIYSRIKEGSFPAPIKLGKHASGWLESAIQAWIQKTAGHASNDDQQQAA